MTSILLDLIALVEKLDAISQDVSAVRQTAQLLREQAKQLTQICKEMAPAARDLPGELAPENAQTSIQLAEQGILALFENTSGFKNPEAATQEYSRPRHVRSDFSTREQYLTCLNCAHPLDENPRMNEGLRVNTTASWAKHHLRLLAEMAEDHGLPDWYSREIRRIKQGIALMESHPDA